MLFLWGSLAYCPLKVNSGAFHIVPILNYIEYFKDMCSVSLAGKLCVRCLSLERYMFSLSPWKDMCYASLDGNMCPVSLAGKICDRSLFLERYVLV